jgi:hypothetical protein
MTVLLQALGITRGIVAAIGAGGKKSLLYGDQSLCNNIVILVLEKREAQANCVHPPSAFVHVCVCVCVRVCMLAFMRSFSF